MRCDSKRLVRFKELWATQPVALRPQACAELSTRLARLARLANKFIQLPTDESVYDVREFSPMGRIPSVVRFIDCTHVVIQNADREDSLRFINRKGRFSNNVQVVCDAKMRIRNMVARWPGSTHDSRIRRNSGTFADYEAQRYRSS